MKKIRVLLTAGGTGGHIYPLIAVAKELKNIASLNDLDLELRFLGSAGDYKNLIELNGIKSSEIMPSKLRRYFSVENFIDFPKFVISLFQAFFKVYFFMPDVVFSKSGPGALPVLFACRFFGIPVVIHESDSVPGLTNTLAQKFAKRIAISFSSSAKYFKNISALALTGNPVNADFFENRKTKEEAKTALGFDNARPLILVLGGSQGSQTINEFILSVLPELAKDFQILHQTGFNNFKEVTNEARFLLEKMPTTISQNYHPMPYLDKEMKDALTAADLVVSRAGSGSVFEISAFGKPAILIPLKESAQDHQRLNAYEFASNLACVVIEEQNLLPNVFLTQVRKVLSDSALMAKMSEASTAFSKPMAGKMIAEEVIKVGLKNN